MRCIIPQLKHITHVYKSWTGSLADSDPCQTLDCQSTFDFHLQRDTEHLSSGKSEDSFDICGRATQYDAECQMPLPTIFKLEKYLQSRPLHAEGSPCVWIGWDTRPSCGGLVKAASDGVSVCWGRGGCIQPKGLLSTPQLHWMVRQTNRRLASTETDYFDALSQAFLNLTGETYNAPQALSSSYYMHFWQDVANSNTV